MSAVFLLEESGAALFSKRQCPRFISARAVATFCPSPMRFFWPREFPPQASVAAVESVSARGLECMKMQWNLSCRTSGGRSPELSETSPDNSFAAFCSIAVDFLLAWVCPEATFPQASQLLASHPSPPHVVGRGAAGEG